MLGRALRNAAGQSASPTLVGLARADHSATAKNAAKEIGPAIAAQYVRILRALRDAGHVGLTCEQVERITGLSGSSVRPRLVELRGEAGRWKRAQGRAVEEPWVSAPEGLTRKTDSGRPAQVHVLTAAGLAALNAATAA